MMTATNSDLEEIRRRKMQELLQSQIQKQSSEVVQQQIKEEQVSSQIKKIINNILTPEARERLGNIRAAKPDYARSVEVLLIQLYQSGRLPNKITDSQLKEILLKLKQNKREIKIEK